MSSDLIKVMKTEIRGRGMCARLLEGAACGQTVRKLEQSQVMAGG